MEVLIINACSTVHYFMRQSSVVSFALYRTLYMSTRRRFPLYFVCNIMTLLTVKAALAIKVIKLQSYSP